MKHPTARLLYWTPRLLGVLFAAFLGLFALDSLGEGRGLLESLAAFAVHLVPTYLTLAVVAVAWRWERTGAVLFAALAVAYLVTGWGRLHWSAFAVISGPLFLLAVLFPVSRVARRQLTTAA